MNDIGLILNGLVPFEVRHGMRGYDVPDAVQAAVVAEVIYSVQDSI